MGLRVRVDYFNLSNYEWEPLVEPAKLEAVGHFKGAGANTVNVRLDKLNFNISPEIVELLVNIKRSLGRVKKGQFVRYYISNHCGFSMEFKATEGTRVRRVKNNCVIPIKSDQLKELLNKEYSSLINILINYSFLSRMNRLFKRVTPRKRAKITHQSTIAERFNDFFKLEFELESLFQDLMEDEPSNVSQFKNLFIFERLKRVNMDIDGIHFNLLELECECLDHRMKNENTERFEQLAAFSNTRRKSLFFSSKLKA